MPLTVMTLFRGKDLLTPIFKRQTKAVGRFGDKASKSFARASKSASNFGTIVKGALTAGLIQRGLSGMVQGARAVTEEFIDFDAALTQAGAKFPTVIKRGTDSFDRLGAVARKVGAETEFSAADAAKGLDFLAMAGFNAEQAMAALPGVTDLATIANTDLARSTDIASDVLGAFNLMTKDSVQLEKNLTRVTDVMASTITSANTDMEFLFETMKMAGPVLTTAGQSLETFTTIAASMANAGVKSTLAGTAMRTAFVNLSAPVPKAKALLKKLGVEIVGADKNMRDFLDILEDVRKSTSKMGNVQKQATLNTLFGKRAIAGMSVVLNATDKELRNFRKNQEMASGTARRMGEDIRKSIGNRLKELRSALIEIGFKFLEAFVGKGEGALDRLIAAVRRFDVKPIVEGIKSVIGVMKVAFDGVKIFGEALWDLRGVIKAVTAVVIAAKVAQWAWNAALLANPLGILVAAIGAAIVVIAVLINKWDSATASMNLAAIYLRNAILNTFDSIKSGVISAINAIYQAISQLTGIEVPQLEVPDNSARIQRDIDLIRARNRLLVAAVKDNKELQAKALVAGESLRGRQRAAQARQIQMPGVSSTDLSEFTVPKSVDPELIRQQVGFKGEISLKGAPEGSTFRGKTRGAPPIKTEVLGANP
jgi:TP901 family phage tail tape measure protein